MKLDNDLLLMLILTLLVAALFFFIISTVVKPPKVVESSFAGLALLAPISFALFSAVKNKKIGSLNIPPEILVFGAALIIGVVIMFFVWGDFRTSVLASIGGFISRLFSAVL